MGPRRAITFPMFGDGIFTQEGPEWKHSREMLRPQLQHKQYENLEVFQTAVDDLIQRIQEGQGSLDLQPLFFRLTLDTTTAFLFGESVRSLITPEAAGERTFATAFNTAQRWSQIAFACLTFTGLWMEKSFDRLAKMCTNLQIKSLTAICLQTASKVGTLADMFSLILLR
jgi:cytochrome P450